MPALHKYLISITQAFLAAFLLFTTTGCEKALDLKDPSTHATAVFDDLWTVMDEHYALFPYKGVDWNNSREKYRAKVHNGMSQTGLFGVLSDMLADLKDGHITLIAPIDTFTYLGFYTDYPANFNYNNIIYNYLKNEYSTSGPIIYKIESGIGYLYYRTFADDVTDQQIDKILTDMAQTKGLIIDVRNNTGGNTKNVDRLVRRFITAKTLMKFEMDKKGPGHDDFLAPQPYYLSPAGQHYSAPVIILTNRSCFSSCNDFVLFMSNLPQVTLMGDQTGGGGGIPRDYYLSNGWKLQYTSTVTLSPAKEIVENGISPDVNVSITSIDEAYGKDPILEKAFQSLQ
jgi:hypothetical protein